jgi:hypothetical protein
MSGDVWGGISIGRPADLVSRERKATGGEVSIPTSDKPRGLAMRSLVVTSGWDRLWNLLGRSQNIYFLSVAFDLSTSKPVVLPPKEIPEGAAFRVQHGEKISFSLGEGAPLFPARTIKGGIVVYVTVCQADAGMRQIGKVIGEVHEALAKEKSLTEAITRLIANPAETVVDEVLKAGMAALSPIATILKNNKDDYEALFTGMFPARGPWDNKLSASQNGVTMELAALS